MKCEYNNCNKEAIYKIDQINICTVHEYKRAVKLLNLRYLDKSKEWNRFICDMGENDLHNDNEMKSWSKLLQ